jgi:hypothetical protein
LALGLREVLAHLSFRSQHSLSNTLLLLEAARLDRKVVAVVLVDY